MEEFIVFAIVNDGKVSAIINVDVNSKLCEAIRSGGQFIETKTKIMTGWVWDGSSFTPPAE